MRQLKDAEVGVIGSGDGRTAGVPGIGAGGRRPYRIEGVRAGGSPQQPGPGTPPGGGQQEEIGYRGPTACAAAGITYRQLDYWARTGLVEPSVRLGVGAGAQRLYGVGDVVVLKIVKRLLDAGVSLQNIRSTVAHLRGGWVDMIIISS